MGKLNYQCSELTIILERFNNRESAAFGEIYTLLYKELYYFASSFFKDGYGEPEDVIQDIFLNIWDDRKRKFENITSLRSFIFVVIRNKFIKEYKHRQVAERASDAIIREHSIFTAIEAEVFSIIPEVLNLLPEECARSFKLFLEGYDVKEIATILQKQPSTIYNQRSESISILRKKLPKDKLLLLLLLIK